MKVAEILSQPNRKWQPEPPASESDLAELLSRARAELPTEYLDLLRFGNGGEGPLALAPLWFQLYSAKDCLELCHNEDIIEQFPEFMFFGGNGGIESIAFDLRSGPPWPIVTVDQIAGADSAEELTPDITSFIAAIGL
jgi:hypothetical protein